ncbi:hypothetical protein VZT92_000550 [Zoarces viviparus]|uniref:BED-type domain-containing protein n=1 Tax=Zoarces viviparus TaxID=48416 RepID=A0AAW1G7H2_ZOAVI
MLRMMDRGQRSIPTEKEASFGAFLKPLTKRIPETTSTNGHEDMETDSKPFSFVEVALEDGDSDTFTVVNEAGFNSAVDGIPEGAQGHPVEDITHEEASDDRPVKRRRNKRSLIWRHYEELHSLAAARCCICMKLQSFEGGSTSNLHRHMSKRHPEVFSQLAAERQHPPPPPPPPSHSSQSSDANVEVVLEDGDFDTLNPTMNGVPGGAQGGPAEQIRHEEASEDHPVKRRRSKRSMIWRHYEQLDSLAAARCRICMQYIQYFKGGSTSNLHRHMSKRHPEVFSQLLADGQHPPPPPPPHSSQSSDANVEVALEDGDSDTFTVVNEAGFNSAVDGIPEGAQGHPVEDITHEEASDDRPVKRRRNKRSLIWRHYEELHSLAAARCCICMKLQSFEGSSTSNLHRHMSKRHPEVFSQLAAERQHPPPPPPHSSQSSDANVEVVLEDGDFDTLNPTMNGVPGGAQGGPAEQIRHEEASEDHPVKCRRSKRSLIWRHYEQLDSLAAARCRICMKKLQYFKGGSTSNLHRHMSKRHPEVFSQLLADGQHPPPPPPPHSSQSSDANGDELMPPENVGATEKQRQFSGLLKVSKASEGEKRVFRRERELIEALRRAQREEARALELQRELLERLRAVNAREAAAEREQIESLRTAQLEEAKDLSRQREEQAS